MPKHIHSSQHCLELRELIKKFPKQSGNVFRFEKAGKGYSCCFGCKMYRHGPVPDHKCNKTDKHIQYLKDVLGEPQTPNLPNKENITQDNPKLLGEIAALKVKVEQLAKKVNTAKDTETRLANVNIAYEDVMEYLKEKGIISEDMFDDIGYFIQARNINDDAEPSEYIKDVEPAEPSDE